MELRNYNVYFFLALLAAISALSFFIFKPFLLPIAVAAVLSVVFRPTYDFFMRKLQERRGLSALSTSIFALLILLIPFTIILTLVVNEITAIYHNISSDASFYDNKVAPIIRYLDGNGILGTFGFSELINKQSVINALSQIGQFSLTFLQTVYQSLIHFIFMTLVMFFSLYYFLVHGKELMKKIMSLSPLRDSHEKMLVSKFISMSRATIKGTIIVAFVQGFIGGLTFAIAGIPSATVWSIVMMFLSLIPMLGSSIIWFPAGLIMLFTGHVWEGIFILIVGLLIISLIDNFLRPELVGKDTQMHPLVVFFATLGGISLFGLMGVILGPIIVALFISLWDIYAMEFKKQLKEFNT